MWVLQNSYLEYDYSPSKLFLKNSSNNEYLIESDYKEFYLYKIELPTNLSLLKYELYSNEITLGMFYFFSNDLNLSLSDKSRLNGVFLDLNYSINDIRLYPMYYEMPSSGDMLERYNKFISNLSNKTETIALYFFCPFWKQKVTITVVDAPVTTLKITLFLNYKIIEPETLLEQSEKLYHETLSLHTTEEKMNKFIEIKNTYSDDLLIKNIETILEEHTSSLEVILSNS